MVAILTLLVAFPAGLLLGSRVAANLTYSVAYLWGFVFQTLYLMLDGNAFRSGEFPWEYGVVTLGIFLTGFGLVEGGHRIGTARRHRRSGRAPVAAQ